MQRQVNVTYALQKICAHLKYVCARVILVVSVQCFCLNVVLEGIRDALLALDVELDIVEALRSGGLVVDDLAANIGHHLPLKQPTG